MFPAPCEYHRAASAAEAIELLGRHPGAKLLAGGHSLIPMMKLRLAAPPALVDIGRIAELRGVREDDATIAVGALTTHAEIAASEPLRRACPILAEAASAIGDPQVRNRGTIGGNIAHADPASDLPAVLVALGATVHLRGPAGTRQVAATDFFVGLLASAVADDELVTEIEVPKLGPGTGSAYLKVEHPASGYAVCGTAAVVALDGGGTVASVSLAFNGVAATPLAAAAVAEALTGGPADDAILARAVDGHLTIDEPLGDLHASGAYRVALARTYGRRALAAARDRARGAGQTL